MQTTYKKISLRGIKIILVGVLTSSLPAQSQVNIKAESAFDFWVGKWEVSWKINDSTTQKGINEITKILDGKVIQENFEDPNSKFKGTSISVYDPNKRSWHQAWADNSGGYFNFIGEWNDSVRIFKTLPEIKDGKINISRMVFRNIQEHHFIWDWEKSEDGGQTWNIKWQIFYKRL